MREADAPGRGGKGGHAGARAHRERARRRVELDRVCCQRRELRPPFYNSSTRAGHREQRARVPRQPTPSDRIPRPQLHGEVNDRGPPGPGGELRDIVEGAWGRAARGETGFSGKWIPRGRGEHVGRGCRRVGRGRAATSSSPHVLPRLGFVCGAPGGGASAARWPARIASGGGGLGAVVAGGAGVGGEARGAVPRPAGGLGRCSAPAGVCLAAERPPRAGCRPRRRSHCTEGCGRAGGRGRPGAPGAESHVSRRRRRRWGAGKARGLGAAAASVLRGEMVRLHGSGGSHRNCGLMLGGGDDRLGPVLGGFPLKEVVGHLKAQSTCF